MGVDKFKHHLYVIPEDSADRQIADGFRLHESMQESSRQVYVHREAGRYPAVRSIFETTYLPKLRSNKLSHVILLIDFDNKYEERMKYFEEAISEDVRDRVFVVGPKRTPEALRKSLGKSFEEIGRSLAANCANEEEGDWIHEQLRHNDEARLRLSQVVKPFLFA